MPTYKVVLTDKRKANRRQPITRTVEASDIFEAAAKAIIDAPGDNEWTARAKDNSTRPVEDRRGRP